MRQPHYFCYITALQFIDFKNATEQEDGMSEQNIANMANIYWQALNEVPTDSTVHCKMETELYFLSFMLENYFIK